jgi:hypothetical protein
MIKEEKYMQVVVVGSSSDDDLITYNKFMQAGADYFESKPPNLNNLKNII